MIRVYPSQLEGEPLEVHQTAYKTTPRKWLSKNAPDCDLETPRFTVHINGELAGLDDVFKPDDVVDIKVLPGEIATIVISIIALVASLAMAFLVKPKVKVPKNFEQEQGSPLKSASLTANTPRYGQPIPEVFGQPPRLYPDFLVPQRSYYTAPKVQWIDSFLCLGNGEFDKDATQVFIGNTPAATLGDAVDIKFYEPGESVADEQAADVWYTSKEVGFTSRGNSGIELGMISDIPGTHVASSYTVDWDVLSVDVGESFPEEWQAGVELLIAVAYPVTVTTGQESIISSAHAFDNLNPFVGQFVEVNSTMGFQGFYQITSYTPAGGGLDASITLATEYGSPVTYLPNGEFLASFEPIFKTTTSGSDFTRKAYPITQRISERSLAIGGVSWANMTASSSLIRISVPAGSRTTGWSGPFRVAPEGEKISHVQADFVFPSGLTKFKDNGDRENIEVKVYYEWREVGQAAWTQVGSYSKVNGFISDGFGFTVIKQLHKPAEIEFRVMRDPKHETKNTQDTIHWTGLRGKLLNRPTKYDGVTTMAVKLRTGDRISSQVENKIWIKATRKLDGQATRDIAPALMHVFKSCGYADRVDVETLNQLHQIWQQRGDTFDYAVTKHSTVKQLCNDILHAGFAELTIDGGLLTPVRDALREHPNFIYSPQEFIEYPAVTTSLVRPDDIDGVEAEYIDEKSGQPEVVTYLLPEDAGNRIEKIKLVGVTNRTKAWRLAARHRRTQAYRRTTFRGTTELHALNSSYMSYDMIQDGIPEFGQSAFVVSVAGLLVTVSEPMLWDGSPKVVAFRRKDGRLTRVVSCTRGATDYDIILAENVEVQGGWSFGGEGNIDPTMAYFGTIDDWAHKVLVTSIAPNNDNTVVIEAVNYDERVYLEDDNVPA